MSISVAALVGLIISASTGSRVEMPTLIEDFAKRDVVFLGEEHDNSAGHQMQLDIIRRLHARRADLVISMEMFERDVQGVLDDYLRGRIDEETFLKHSRPWGNYAEHYRPIIEYAKAEGLDVIAANAPRRSARKVAQGGGDMSAYTARRTTAPKDQYWMLFQEAMKEHPGEMSEKALLGMYAAQCMKDDTMAESIDDYLRGRPHRRPLVVHLCGKFHSDYGLGTVVRLLQRRPLATVGVASMTSAEDVKTADVQKDLEKGHYLLVVQAEPKKKPAPKPPKKPDAKPVAKADPGQPAKPKAADVGEDAGPAALGIMPDYGSDEKGVLVGGVSGGGAAEKAGIKAEDLIVKIGDETIESLEDYMEIMGGYRAGQKAKIVVKRDGETKTLDVTFSVRRR